MDSINYSQRLISSSQILLLNGSFLGKCSERTRLRWVCPALKSDFSGEPCGLVSVSFTCQFTNEARFFRLFEFQSWIYKGKIYVLRYWCIHYQNVILFKKKKKKGLLCVCLSVQFRIYTATVYSLVLINLMNQLF